MLYTSYKLLQTERQKSIENYTDSADTGMAIGMIIFIALLAIMEIVFTVFAFIYSFKCHATGKIPTWALVIFCFFLIIPTPIQPMLALALTIYGKVSGC